MDQLEDIVHLQTLKKRHKQETHRLCSPEQTLEKYLKLTPVFGITRLANITGLDTLQIPTFLACRPNSRSLSVSQGKGFTNAAAKASALMESIENYHAEHITLPLIFSSYQEIRFNHTICNLSGLPRCKNSGFSEHTRLHWIEGYDLINHCPKLLPYELVHLDYRDPLPCDHGHFVSSSNGLASGNHIVEAINHGICELIERDALALWHLKTPVEQNSVRVDPDSLTDKKHKFLIGQFRKAGLHIGIWDITSDTGIPSFLCRILPSEAPPECQIRPASGAGCHLDKNIALIRAMTEAAQSRLTYISGARDDLSRESYQKSISLEFYNSWRRQIADHYNFTSFGDIQTYHQNDFLQDLGCLVERLQAVGIREILAVNLTKPDFEIPVVRMVIPELDGYFPPAEAYLTQRAGQMVAKRMS